MPVKKKKTPKPVVLVKHPGTKVKKVLQIKKPISHARRLSTPASSKTPRLRILFVASEMAPFVKEGGLADVVGTLPGYLREQDIDARVVIPLYGSIDRSKIKLSEALASMCVWMGGCEEWCKVWQTTIERGVVVYFVEHHKFFNRHGIYHNEWMDDYGDNSQRFGFFCRAALQLCHDIGFAPDVVHSHDWPAAATCAYQKIWHWSDTIVGPAASVLTIHNAAYQGIYPGHHYGYLGLGARNFGANTFECFGNVNLLKGGIHFADMVTTVSPGYAKEVRTPHGGFGIAPYLTDKGDAFCGILNGVDYSTWSPSNDRVIVARYDVDNLEGKQKCKRALQKQFMLNEDENVAVIGIVGRFVHQKGFHLAAECIERIVNTMHVQFVILGSGESWLQDYFGSLPARYPGKIGSWIGFSNERAHIIEAGADFFLMPSLYEPCGLNQMYSLRYGTLPIVRATGGLDDTVENYNESTGNGTGFKFWEPASAAIYYTVGWAISTWYDRPHHIAAMRRRAMMVDFSWERRTAEYISMYEKAIANKRNYDAWCAGGRR